MVGLWQKVGSESKKHKFSQLKLGGGAKLHKNFAQKLLAISLCAALMLLGVPAGWSNYVTEAAGPSITATLNGAAFSSGDVLYSGEVLTLTASGFGDGVSVHWSLGDPREPVAEVPDGVTVTALEGAASSTAVLKSTVETDTSVTVFAYTASDDGSQVTVSEGFGVTLKAAHRGYIFVSADADSATNLAGGAFDLDADGSGSLFVRASGSPSEYAALEIAQGSGQAVTFAAEVTSGSCAVTGSALSLSGVTGSDVVLTVSASYDGFYFEPVSVRLFLSGDSVEIAAGVIVPRTTAAGTPQEYDPDTYTFIAPMTATTEGDVTANVEALFDGIPVTLSVVAGDATAATFAAEFQADWADYVCDGLLGASTERGFGSLWEMSTLAAEPYSVEVDLCARDTSGSEVALSSAATVSVTSPVLKAFPRKNFGVRHVTSTGACEDLKVDRIGNTLLFKTDHFSPFVFYAVPAASGLAAAATGDFARFLILSGFPFMLIASLGVLLKLLTNKNKFKQ